MRNVRATGARAVQTQAHITTDLMHKKSKHIPTASEFMCKEEENAHRYYTRKYLFQVKTQSIPDSNLRRRERSHRDYLALGQQVPLGFHQN
jgi:hypothetical protein